MAYQKNEYIGFAVGATLAIGLVMLGARYQKRCKDFPGVWSKTGPIYLTGDALDAAESEAKLAIKEAKMAGDNVYSEEIQARVANAVIDCEWGDADELKDNLSTARGQQVWDSIGKVIDYVVEKAEGNPSYLDS